MNTLAVRITNHKVAKLDYAASRLCKTTSQHYLGGGVVSTDFGIFFIRLPSPELAAGAIKAKQICLVPNSQQRNRTGSGIAAENHREQQRDAKLHHIIRTGKNRKAWTIPKFRAQQLQLPAASWKKRCLDSLHLERKDCLSSRFMGRTWSMIRAQGMFFSS